MPYDELYIWYYIIILIIHIIIIFNILFFIKPFISQSLVDKDCKYNKLSNNNIIDVSGNVQTISQSLIVFAILLTIIFIYYKNEKQISIFEININNLNLVFGIIQISIFIILSQLINGTSFEIQGVQIIIVIIISLILNIFKYIPIISELKQNICNDNTNVFNSILKYICQFGQGIFPVVFTIIFSIFFLILIFVILFNKYNIYNIIYCCTFGILSLYFGMYSIDYKHIKNLEDYSETILNSYEYIFINILLIFLGFLFIPIQKSNIFETIYTLYENQLNIFIIIIVIFLLVFNRWPLTSSNFNVINKVLNLFKH